MSSFGSLFRVTTFGESHCSGVGCIVEGVPPRMALDAATDLQPQLTRRRPGQSSLSTPRNEADAVTILSGVENGVTLGTPVAMLVKNRDQRPHDYSEMADVPRPSHADYTYQMKYGVRASSGGGRSSARETIGRVAAGSLAEKWLRDRFQTNIIAFVSSVGDISVDHMAAAAAVESREQVDRSVVRCPDEVASQQMVRLIERVRDERDSVGGVLTCVCRNVPVGLGEPCFDKLEAKLAQAMLSIPATKGFEIGSGFEGATMRGSQHNDMFVGADDKAADAAAVGDITPLKTSSNRSGGIQGGISNGQDIVFRVAFKPPATIGLPQQTAAFNGSSCSLEARGRHDPCVVPRAVPIVEAMAALTLADAALQQLSRTEAASYYPAMGKAHR